MKLKNLPRTGTKLLTKAIILAAKSTTKGILFVGKNALKGAKEAIHETSQSQKS